MGDRWTNHHTNVMFPTQTLALTAEEMKKGADAITLIGRPVSAIAVEDRVKHGRIHLCIMKELPRA